MTNYSVKNVDDYILAAPEKARSHLKEIRDIIKSAIPEAEEKIGYGKPFYKTSRWLIGFDVYKHHIGFEIYDGQLNSEDRKMLEKKGYKFGNKTFQIRYDQKVPIDIIKKLAKAQVKLNELKSKG